MRCCGGDGHAHGHVVGDDCDFGLVVNFKILAGEAHGIARAAKAIGQALVHERFGGVIGRHGDAARAPRLLHVMQIDRAIEELITARQGAGRRAWRKGQGLVTLTGCKCCAHLGELWRQAAPVIQRLLQSIGDLRHRHRALEAAVDHHQGAVPSAAFQTREFHGDALLRWVKLQMRL